MVPGYDAAASGGRRNFANFPVGPSDAPNKKPTGGAFEFDGGEIIFSLPNGLQAYMLANAEGARIDVGPTTIGSIAGDIPGCRNAAERRDPASHATGRTAIPAHAQAGHHHHARQRANRRRVARAG